MTPSQRLAHSISRGTAYKDRDHSAEDRAAAQALLDDDSYVFTTAFQDGGIVGLTSNMNFSSGSGEGLESFLSPARSKATLRRNLAKLAPRPTVQVPVMQQGIMPMAR